MYLKKCSSLDNLLPYFAIYIDIKYVYTTAIFFFQLKKQRLPFGEREKKNNHNGN